MVVRFTEGFEKELKKRLSKTEARSVVLNLAKTKPTDGDFVSVVADVLLKEKRLKSFRFYFVQELSKKNNQQDIIDKLKEDLKTFGF